MNSFNHEKFNCSNIIGITYIEGKTNALEVTKHLLPSRRRSTAKLSDLAHLIGKLNSRCFPTMYRGYAKTKSAAL